MNLIDDSTDFSAYLAEPEGQERVRPAASFTDEVIRRFSTPEEMQGLALPWAKTRNQFRIRPHELTLWNGFSGHGKSLVQGQVMLSMAQQGEKILIASMEMKPVATMTRMARQAIGTATPTPQAVREFAAWTDGRLWIYDRLGSVKWRQLIAVMRYSAQNLGVTQFVIDSLMRCGIADDDYNGQKEFLDALTTFKMDYRAHVHLVLHSRKREDENTPPGKLDIKGSGTVSDLADNVVTTWRNKRKESAVQQAHYQRSKADVAVLDQPDALLIVDKQRHGEWEGRISLWFQNGPMQYVETSTSQSTSVEFSK
jgi:twinkle protein